jgi:hypothetical protein
VLSRPYRSSLKFKTNTLEHIAMPTFVLTPDHIGDLAEDGSILKHPTLDILGNDATSAASRVNATRKRLSKTQFCVIPTGKDSDDNVFVLPSDKPAPKAKE